MEPHGPVSDDIDAMTELLDSLGEPLGVNLDTGNLWLGWGEPLAFIERFGEKIKHVHWKDYPASWESMRGKVFGSGKSDIPLGDGVVGVEEVARELVRIGFDGPTTLEVAGIDNITTSVARLREWCAAGGEDQ
jgi:inosose dehydratase